MAFLVKEIELRHQIERVANQRRALPMSGEAHGAPDPTTLSAILDLTNDVRRTDYYPKLKYIFAVTSASNCKGLKK